MGLIIQYNVRASDSIFDPLWRFINLLTYLLTYGLWTFRSQDVSFPIRNGRFVPWTFRSMGRRLCSEAHVKQGTLSIPYF